MAESGVLQRARLPEPLVRARPTSAAEDSALSQSLDTYASRLQPDDQESLVGYLAVHPASGWAAGLWLNVGLDYLHYGYFSKALDAFKQSWLAGKDATAPDARRLVDRAIGERTRLLASFGRHDELRQLLAEIDGRPISGSATEAVQTTREQLSQVTNKLNHLFLCGPLALRGLLVARHAEPSRYAFLDRFHATPQGTTLADLALFAKKASLATKIVHREPGGPMPNQAIVHWKLGHFGALIGTANGRLHIVDSTLAGGDIWMTPEAFESEASGYLLVPVDDPATSKLGAVPNFRAATIRGTGATPGTLPGDPGGPAANPSTEPCPLCMYNINESNVGLTLTDTPVGYDPPIGPSTRVTVNYNQRNDSQPANFPYYNLGPKWSLEWLDFITDDPTNPGGNVSRYLNAGGATYYSGYSSGTGRFTAEGDGSVLTLSSQSPVIYRRQTPDGAIRVYSQSDGSATYPRTIFLTDIINPQGNALHLAYDAQNRLTTVSDAAGRQTKLSYGSLLQPLLVTQITDPFGRYASFSYDASGRLASITDIIGLTSSFAYDANSLVKTLTTPYGMTSFAFTVPGTSGPPRFVDVTDPLGNHEREEWLEPAPIASSDPAATVPTGMPIAPVNDYLQYRDSFHWNKDQYTLAGCTPTGGCDYSKARMTHFLHDGIYKSSITESIKEPLENRVWYQYPAQTNSIYTGSYSKPIAKARVLDDGTTQLSKVIYDAANYFVPTQFVDPQGRTTNLAYVNGIDVQTVTRQVTSGTATLAQLTYNGKHQPLTITDAAGQTTTLTYNAAGQVLTSTNALSQVTKYQYNAAGDLLTITNPNNVTARTYSYDALDRVATLTDSEGYMTTYSYDNADRVTQVLYPDGTKEKYAYDRLFPSGFTDRQSRSWAYAYDVNGNLTSVTDPAGKQASVTFSKQGRPLTFTDYNNHATTWTYDVQGRIATKKFADASVVTYTYETTTSRLKSVKDALNQIKQYSYTADDMLAGIGYQAVVNPTNAVTFAYDTYYPRVASMTDAVGTTQFSYGAVGSLGALELSQETAPLVLGSVAYGYDALGRLSSRTVSGSGVETVQYDALGRPSQHDSDLGTFLLTYLGQTDQIAQRALSGTGATLKTSWSYLNNAGDRRLSGVSNTGLTSSQFSNFQIATSQDGTVTGVTESSDAAALYPTTQAQVTATYNSVNALTNLGSQVLTYDANGNLKADGTRTYAWDAENRLVSVGYPAQPGRQTNFQYDGLGRRVSRTSIPTGGGTGTTTNDVWCGSMLCQARNGSGAVIRSYLAEGEYVPGSPGQRYYYGIDQIGSVRRAFATTTSALAYAYDPYGVPLNGTAPVVERGFAGMRVDPDSGLNFTLYRAYSPSLSRWVSRDPLGEVTADGTNLYGYVSGNPASLIDPLGLCTQQNTNPKPPTCGNGLASKIASVADKVSLYSGGLAATSGLAGLVAAPTGAGFVGFEGVAAVSGLVSLGASGVGAVAHAFNGDYIGAGLDAAGLVAGPLAGKLAGNSLAAGRAFGDLSASQARQAGLIGNGLGTAAGAAGSLYSCR